jgi:hypothetical protein
MPKKVSKKISRKRGAFQSYNLHNYSIVSFNASVRSATSLYLHTIPQKQSKAVPLHAMVGLGGRGGIAPTHS